ncbi:MAG TPA: alpha/beta fold hydrolase [Thermoanaerobaculia bacterium]
MEIKSSADYVRMTRAALAAAGLVRMESEGMVWWETSEEQDVSRSAGVPPAVRAASRRPGSGEDEASRPMPPSPARPGGGAGRRHDSRRDAGAPSRPTLVLLHGVNDNAGTWFTVAPALAERFRLILPDLPGHGESEPRDSELPIPMLVDRLEAILPEEPFALLGNSLGGWLSMLYTLRHPERVRTLILEASGGIDRPFGVPLLATNREDADVILRAVHGPDFSAPQWTFDALLERAQDSPMLRLTGTAEHHLDGRLGELHTEVHLIWGADDGVLPLSYAHELQRGIPGAQLHVLEGAAHIPHLQQPQRFLECLTAIC